MLDGNEYLDFVIKMKEITGENYRLVNQVESTDFRSVVRCIGYLESGFRCHISFVTSILGRNFISHTVFSAKKANATIYSSK